MMLADFKVEQTGAGTYMVSVKLNSADQLRKLLEFIVSNSPQPPDRALSWELSETVEEQLAEIDRHTVCV